MNVDDTAGATLAGVDDGKLNGEELSTGKNVDSSSLLVVVVVVVVVAKMKQKKIVYLVFRFFETFLKRTWTTGCSISVYDTLKGCYDNNTELLVIKMVCMQL